MAARGLVFFVGAVSASTASWSTFAADSSALEPSADCESTDCAALVCEAGSLGAGGAEAGTGEGGAGVSAAGGCFAASVFSGVAERSSCGVMVCESVVDAGGGSVGVCADEFVELDGAMIASTRCNAATAGG